jgi:hypothetical protein
MKNNNCSCKPFTSNFEYRHDNRKTAVFRDKRSSTEYRYENKTGDHLAKYRIDGGLIADNGEKCDYLLLNCEKRASYFIELKGSDIIKAVEQIERSIEVLGSSLKSFIINARIVCTRINTINLRDPRVLRLEKKVRGFKGDLKKQTRQLIEKN